MNFLLFDAMMFMLCCSSSQQQQICLPCRLTLGWSARFTGLLTEDHDGAAGAGGHEWFGGAQLFMFSFLLSNERRAMFDSCRLQTGPSTLTPWMGDNIDAW
jgi:nitrous oxide reductase accessory protein NosL